MSDSSSVMQVLGMKLKEALSHLEGMRKVGRVIKRDGQDHHLDTNPHEILMTVEEDIVVAYRISSGTCRRPRR